MSRRHLSILLIAVAAPLLAQDTPTPEQQRRNALVEQHQGDFDYLLGDWCFTAHSQEWGAYGGFWSAQRLAGGGILDEFRVTSDTGETWHVSNTVRTYNPYLDRWELVGVDGQNGLKNIGAGRREGAEIHLEQTFSGNSPTPDIWRIRYYDIRPDRFSWSADRSTDGGRTWTSNWLRIEARRIGPPRTELVMAPFRRTR